MAANSLIEWTDRTWNVVRGCSRVSPGCDNCYAMGQAHRFAGPGKPFDGLTRYTAKRGVDWAGFARFVPEKLAEPLSWRKPQRIFVNSMSDLFHESLSNEEIAAVFGVMAACPQHTFQILTKRPKRMREWQLREAA
jgi:protein gp37